MLNPNQNLNPEQSKFIQIISSLTFKELNILMERYVMGSTLNEIAQNYKVTTERIRQTEANALKKISLHSKLIKKYVTSKTR